MKKVLVMMIALLALTTTVNAQTRQTLTEKQKRDAVENMIKSKLKWVSTSKTAKVQGYYITFLPVTWYEYWAVTGVKKHSDQTSISKAAIVLDNEKETFVKMLNQYLNLKGVKFKLPTSNQVSYAHHKIGLHDDVSNISYNHGFYIIISKKGYETLMQYVGVGGLGAVG
ncbi:MAG: hypothetical protein IJP46_09695 [Prevotella sp.]|nr:hypothetical protein [Prevotella sp.]